MTEFPGQPQITRPKTDWTSWLQLVYSVVVLITLGGIGLLLLAGPYLSLQLSLADGLAVDSMIIILGLSCLTLALFPLLSVITCGFRLAGKAQPRWLSAPQRWLRWLPVPWAGLVVAVWFLLTFGSSQVLLLSGLSWYIPPVLTVLCIFLPIVWLMRVGTGNVWGKFPKRDSGLLSLSIGFTTPLILMVEVIIVLILLVVVGVAAASVPALREALEQMVTNLSHVAQDPELVMEAIRPLLSSPWFIAGLLLLLSVLAPLVEELLKTLGVWFLGNRAITPAQGFVAGVMSGAGFALVEGLFNATQALSGSSGADWLFLILGRFGGSLLHIFNGGLMGWALAKTWQDRKVWRVVGIFALVFVLHGVWNAFALAAGVFPFLQGGLESTSWYYLPLGVIFVVVLAAFLAVSRRLTGGSKVRELL